MTTACPKAHPQAIEAAEAPSVRRVAFDAPWGWLDLGWKDLWASPKASLGYGAIFCACALLIVFALFEAQAIPLILPLTGGFLIAGPILAVGSYEISSQKELGRRISFRDALSAAFAARGRLLLFGVMLLIIYFFWVRTAFLLFMLFFGPNDFPPLPQFISTLLFTPHGLGLLVTGTLVGAVFALLTFSMSAIAVPMLLDRPIDPITASLVSMNAVFLNVKAMILWACLIAAATAAGLATLFVGLAVTFPLIGHATWHAYRDLTGSGPTEGKSSSN